MKMLRKITTDLLTQTWVAKKAARGFDATSGEFEQWVENRVRKNAINNNTGTLLYFPTRYREGSTPHNAAPFAVVGYGGIGDTGLMAREELAAITILELREPPTAQAQRLAPSIQGPCGTVGMRALDTGGYDAEGGADTLGGAVAQCAGGSGAVCVE